MTSHGLRIDLCHLAIESIARGTVRPRRIVLWLDASHRDCPLPATLDRLRRCGLEVGWTTDVAPHTKYVPALRQMGGGGTPLVVADDDSLSAADWLERLDASECRHPDAFPAYRCRQILMRDGRFEPYGAWPITRPADGDLPRFVTAVGGALLTPVLIAELLRRRTAFEQVAPRCDDTWINAVALQADIPIVQIAQGVRSRLGVPHGGPGISAVVDPSKRLLIEATLGSEVLGRSTSFPPCVRARGDHEARRLALGRPTPIDEGQSGRPPDGTRRHCALETMRSPWFSIRSNAACGQVPVLCGKDRSRWGVGERRRPSTRYAGVEREEWIMECQESVDIAVSAEEAWTVLAEVMSWPTWTPTMTSVDPEGAAGLAVGARFAIAQPKLPVLTWVVTELTEGSSFAWEARSPGLRTVAVHRVESRGPSACTVTLELRQSGPLSGVASLLSGRRTRQMVATEAASLRAHLLAA